MKSQNDNRTPGTCSHDHAAPTPDSVPDLRALERAARMFRAMGDTPRLRMLQLISMREVCVGELVSTLQEKFSTVSQRLRLLRTEGLVTRRRDGSHVYYALADDHVRGLVANALDHAYELNGLLFPIPESEDE